MTSICMPTIAEITFKYKLLSTQRTQFKWIFLPSTEASLSAFSFRDNSTAICKNSIYTKVSARIFQLINIIAYQGTRKNSIHMNLQNYEETYPHPVPLDQAKNQVMDHFLYQHQCQKVDSSKEKSCFLNPYISVKFEEP